VGWERGGTLAAEKYTHWPTEEMAGTNEQALGKLDSELHYLTIFNFIQYK
jgi:hypothetical protein